MSEIDFQNGFMCGIAVKGIPGGAATGKHTCPIIVTFDFKIIDIGFKIVDYTPPKSTLEEE